MHSLLTHIPKVIANPAARQMLVLSKHSPTLLFAGGVIGVVATTVVASRATLHLSETLEEAKNDIDLAKKILVEERPDYTEKDYRKDVAVIYARTAHKVAKLYAPAFGIGVISIACLTGSHHILTKRNVALTAAYSSLERGFRHYREGVIRDYGQDVDDRLRHDHEWVKKTDYDPETDQNRSHVVPRAKKTPNDYSIYAKFFDKTCGDVWSPVPEYNRIFLQAQQNFCNDMLRARGHVFLNEVYDMLGMERTNAGAVVGWVMSKRGGDNYVDFGIFDGSREKVRDFVNAHEGAILLDFNVDGVIYDKI